MNELNKYVKRTVYRIPFIMNIILTSGIITTMSPVSCFPSPPPPHSSRGTPQPLTKTYL